MKALLRTGLIGLSKTARENARESYPFLSQLSDGVLSAPSAGLRSLETLTNRSEHCSEPILDLSIGYPKGFTWMERGLDERMAQAQLRGVGFDGYPPYAGWPAVLEAVAQEIRKKTGASFEPGRELLLTSGATQGAAIVLETLLNPGERVVLFDPTYLFFAYPLLIKRAKLAWVPSRVDDGNVQFDESKLRSALQGAKLLFLNSPVNPTGGVLSRAVMKRVLDLAAEAGVIVLSDEIYQDFCWGLPWTSAAAFPEHRSRVIVNHSYSKSLGMAGWRCGYLAGPVGLIRPMTMVSAMFSPYAASVSQAVLLSLLPDLEHFLGPVVRQLQENARTSALILRPRFPRLEEPKAGIFHWLDVPETFRGTSEAYCDALFRSTKILVMPGEHFGPGNERRFRISFVGEPSQLTEACRRLAAFEATA